MSQRLIAGLLVFGCILVVSFGYSRTSETPAVVQLELVRETTRYYRDPEGRFELTAPPSWMLVQPDGTTDAVHFVYLAMAEQGRRAAISLFVQPATNNLSAVAQAAEAYIQQQPGVTDFRSETTPQAGNGKLTGLTRTLHYTLEGWPIVQRMVYLQESRSTFVFSLLVHETAGDRYQTQFEEMVNSFVATTYPPVAQSD